MLAWPKGRALEMNHGCMATLTSSRHVIPKLTQATCSWPYLAFTEQSHIQRCPLSGCLAGDKVLEVRPVANFGHTATGTSIVGS